MWKPIPQAPVPIFGASSCSDFKSASSIFSSPQFGASSAKDIKKEPIFGAATPIFGASPEFRSTGSIFSSPQFGAPAAKVRST
jgi:hypothetical protein